MLEELPLICSFAELVGLLLQFDDGLEVIVDEGFALVFVVDLVGGAAVAEVVDDVRAVPKALLNGALPPLNTGEGGFF